MRAPASSLAASSGRRAPWRPLGASALAGLALGACAPSLTPLGARVRVAEAVSPADCRVVGEVDGQDRTLERARVRLRNAAGELHANCVQVTETVDSGGRVHLHGQAFGCRPP